ncbi:hypothetical protein G4G27_05770 [Sphingomonas sp. So64.6b]|uniref:putative immunity protein n=1 Tax=Sphingomonas sp. So64.6b TaxID=2997354 RepID=UPI00160299E8|nr:hypothetical protein [Sphingomonas sp. So64.6b]QNA83565.1 hypothetical protein G4G27_05770 [Sphingomonas sp. So64.6b]
MDHDPGAPQLTIEDLRHIARWAADCAERTLPIFEAKALDDTRPRDAIAESRVFADGGTRTATLRKIAWAAHAVAREVGDPAAAAAARAASTAAASAYTHPIATPHQVNHILGPAAYAAHATILAAAGDDGVGEAEIRWAIERASLAVRQAVRRMPARAPGKGPLGLLFYRLDTGLRY